MDWFQIGKGACQGCILLPCLFNLYAQYIMWNARLDEAQAGIKIAGKNIITPDMQMTPPNGRKQRGTKEPLDEGERGEWKSWLITQHTKKLRSWHLVPSLHGKKMGKQWKHWQDFIFLGYKITADGDCSQKIKRHLLLGRKAMTNLDSILKGRDSPLLTKVLLVKVMVFPVVMYGCESWTIKKAECWRIDALELWCWGGLLRVPWTKRRSNQSIPKEINPEYSLEGLMLKLQYLDHLIQSADSL